MGGEFILLYWRGGVEVFLCAEWEVENFACRTPNFWPPPLILNNRSLKLEKDCSRHGIVSLLASSPMEGKYN